MQNAKRIRVTVVTLLLLLSRADDTGGVDAGLPQMSDLDMRFGFHSWNKKHCTKKVIAKT